MGKEAKKASGAYAIEAAEWVMELCRMLSVEFHVAPYEAESQLIGMQHSGKIWGMIAFDSDYITGGATLVMLDASWRKMGGKVYSAASITKDFIVKESFLGPAVAAYGPVVFRLSSYMLQNDYTHIFGCG